MGTGATLYRISKSKINSLKEDVFAVKENKQMIYLDKLWEHVLYILGNGFLGTKPFINIFAPKNKLQLSKKQEEMGRSIHYNDKKEIEIIESALDKISESIITKRCNIDEINNKIKCQLQNDEKKYLINLCIEIKDIFKKAKEEDDIIVCTLG